MPIWPLGIVNARQKAWPYIVQSVVPGLVVQLNDIKAHCRLDFTENYILPVFGTSTVTNGSAVVTGVNTLYTFYLAATQVITIAGVSYQILSVDSNTQFTLTTTYAGVDAEGVQILEDPEDLYLIRLSQNVTRYCELYTSRIFLTTNFLTYRDQFTFASTFLRRSPLQSVTQIQYYSMNVLTTVPTNIYYNSTDTQFSAIHLQPNQSWPSPIDPGFEKVQITFVAGAGDDFTGMMALYPGLYEGMLNHCCEMYYNRGDDNDQIKDKGIPNQSKIQYDMYKIINIVGDDYSNRLA